MASDRRSTLPFEDQVFLLVARALKRESSAGLEALRHAVRYELDYATLAVYELSLVEERLRGSEGPFIYLCDHRKVPDYVTVADATERRLWRFHAFLEDMGVAKPRLHAPTSPAGLSSVELKRLASTFRVPNIEKLFSKDLVLECGRTKVSHIPQELSRLTHIVTLELSNENLSIGLKSFPTVVTSLTQLRELDLRSHPCIRSIPDSVCEQLLKLQCLLMDLCGLTELPEQIEKLSSLRVLHVRGNKIKKLPKSFCKMSKLRSVDLKDNAISSLSLDICSLREAWIGVEGNPLTTPPIEVCEKGFEAVISYHNLLQATASQRKKRLKIVVLGECMCGKTSLLMTLFNERPSRTKERDRTIGIDFHKARIADTSITFMDCGGQRAYMLISQLPVSDNTLFIVLADISSCHPTDQTGFKRTFGNYLQVIYDRCKYAVVIPVFSKVDMLSKGATLMGYEDSFKVELDRYLKLRAEELKHYLASQQNASTDKFIEDQCIHVEQCHFTSAVNMKGIRQLKETIKVVVSSKISLPAIEQGIPSAWVTFEDEVIKSGPSVFSNLPNIMPLCGYSPLDRKRVGLYGKRKLYPVVSIHTIIYLGKRLGLDSDETRQVLQYLNKVGCIMFFPHHQLQGLQNVVFTSVPAVITVLGSLFHHNQAVHLNYDDRFVTDGNCITREEFEAMKYELVENAVIRIPLLRGLWSSLGLREEHIDPFIRMLLSLDFGYLTCRNQREVEILMETQDKADERLWNFEIGLITNDTLAMCLEVPAARRLIDATEVSMGHHLVSLNAGILLPWFLSDTRPGEVDQLWHVDCPPWTIQVVISYSFVYAVPAGLFQRLASRCHRHANFIRHWLSGILFTYGPVTALFLSSGTASGRSPTITLSVSVPHSNNCLSRLWHVLLRCIMEMEFLLSSTLGVLFRRYISNKPLEVDLPTPQMSFSSKATIEPLPNSTASFVWIDRNTDSTQGLGQHRRVLPSISVQQPLRDVFSSECGQLVTDVMLRTVSRSVDSSNLEDLAVELGLELEDLDAIMSAGGMRSQAIRVLHKWKQKVGQGAMACVLADALYASGLQLTADREFGHIHDTILRPQSDQKDPAGVQDVGSREPELLGSTEGQPTAPITRDTKLSEPNGDLSGFPSAMQYPVTESAIIQAAVAHGSSQWYSFGLKLGFNHDEITCITHDKPEMEEKLQALFQRKAKNVSSIEALERLVRQACETVPTPIIGVVKDELRKKSDSTV